MLNRTLFLSLIVTIAFACTDSKQSDSKVNSGKVLSEIPQLDIDFVPEKYVAYKADSPIKIDGELTDEEWGEVEWTSEFNDLEGDKKPAPLYGTKTKMLWDDEYFYFAAEIVEPHIWASLKNHDDIILYNNDYEIFLDPDGDTHNYCEIEMNAFGTIWDLILTQPYRDEPHVIDSWHIYGLKKAVKIYGTLNDPSDVDEKWTIEIAVPWKVVSELNSHGGAPNPGEQWRVNLMRVNHKIDIVDGKYQRKIDPTTQKPFPCFNWIWVVSGTSGCHAPELWGFVQFSDKEQGSDRFVDNKNDDVKWALRQVYYRQRAFKKEHKAYASTATQLKLADVKVDGIDFDPEITTFNGRWEAKQKGFNGKTVYIRWDGKVWAE